MAERKRSNPINIHVRGVSSTLLADALKGQVPAIRKAMQRAMKEQIAARPFLGIDPKTKLRDIAREAHKRGMRASFRLVDPYQPHPMCRCIVVPLKTQEKESTMSPEGVRAMTPEDGRIIAHKRHFNIIAQAFDANGTLIETATFKYTGEESRLSGWVRDHEQRNGRRCVVTIGECDPFHPRERLGLTPPVPEETMPFFNTSLPKDVVDKVTPAIERHVQGIVANAVTNIEKVHDAKVDGLLADARMLLAEIRRLKRAQRKPVAKPKKRTRR